MVAAESAATVVILTFIPCWQWPDVPQAKKRIPGLVSLIVLLPPLNEFNEVLVSQLLSALSLLSSTTLCNPAVYLNSVLRITIITYFKVGKFDLLQHY